MAKFFRRIHQQILAENRFSKYLLYATGEIVLVVIGILIALQVNTWNENVKRNKLEQKVLVNLKQDFEYNRSELLRVMETNNRYMESGRKILNHTGNRFSRDFEIDSILNDIATTVSFHPNNGFLNDLINSGNLGIIKNDLLRNRLSSWLPKLEDIKESQVGVDEFQADIIRFIIKNGSWLNVDEVASSDIISQIEYPKSGFQINNNELLKSLEFENLVENKTTMFYVVKNTHQKCLELNEEILDLLNSEIEK